MAITFRDSEFGYGSTGVNFALSFDVTIPLAAQVGDIALAFVALSSPVTDITVPTGWEVAHAALTSTGVGTALETRSFWKKIETGDPGSTFTVAVPVGEATKGQAHVAVYAGADGDSPISAIDCTDYEGDATSWDTPTVTAPNGSGLVEFVVDRVGSNSGTWTVPSPMTERDQTVPTGLISSVVADHVGVSGSVGAHTYTVSMSAPQAHAYSVALNPVSAVASTVRPSSVHSNAGGFVAVGASDIPTALSDSSDSTYAESPQSPSGAGFTLNFPEIAEGLVTVIDRRQSSLSSPAITRKYELLSDGVVVATRTSTMTASWTNYQFTITEAEKADITSWTLQLRMTDTSA